jgi:hypothetical protein
MTSGSLGSNGEITSNLGPSVSRFEQLGTQALQLAESQLSNCYLKRSGDFVIDHAPVQHRTSMNTRADFGLKE